MFENLMKGSSGGGVEVPLGNEHLMAFQQGCNTQPRCSGYEFTLSFHDARVLH